MTTRARGKKWPRPMQTKVVGDAVLHLARGALVWRTFHVTWRRHFLDGVAGAFHNSASPRARAALTRFIGDLQHAIATKPKKRRRAR